MKKRIMETKEAIFEFCEISKGVYFSDPRQKAWIIYYQALSVTSLPHKAFMIAYSPEKRNEMLERLLKESNTITVEEVKAADTGNLIRVSRGKKQHDKVYIKHTNETVEIKHTVVGGFFLDSFLRRFHFDDIKPVNLKMYAVVHKHSLSNDIPPLVMAYNAGNAIRFWLWEEVGKYLSETPHDLDAWYEQEWKKCCNEWAVREFDCRYTEAI